MDRRELLTGALGLAVSTAVRGQIIPPKPLAMGFASGVSAPSSGPVITSLAPLSLGVTDWTAFLAATGGKGTWPVNGTYNAGNGVKLVRMTSRSNVPGGGSGQNEYSEGGPRISQKCSDGAYWFLFGTWETGNTLFVGKYKMLADGGSGVVTAPFAPSISPLGVAGNLGSIFSTLPGEENIMYLANKGGNTVHRFDVSLNAFAPNAIFAGTNASYTPSPIGNGAPGWMQISWDGSRLVWMAAWTGLPSVVYCLMLSGGSAGTLYAYQGSPTSQIQVKDAVVSGGASTTGCTASGSSFALGPSGHGIWFGSGISITFTTGVNAGLSRSVTDNTATTVTFAAFPSAPAVGDKFTVLGMNELHVCRGPTNAVFVMANNNLGAFPTVWFPAQGVTTQYPGTSFDYYGGHSDGGYDRQYTLNPQGVAVASVKSIQSTTIGSAPGADGGAYTGTQNIALYGTSALTDIDNSSADGHFNMNYNQLAGGGAGNEYILHDSNGDYYTATANGWTLDSGNVYKTTITFDSHFQQSSRGIVGAIIYNGSAPGSGQQILGNLTPAGSRGAMTAGTFFWNGTTLYAWLPNGTQPNTTTGSSGNFLSLNSCALGTFCIAAFKGDGTDARRVCWQYCITNENNLGAWYYRQSFPNWSPDGRWVMYGSDMGLEDGFSDLIAAEFPTS